MKQYVLFSNRYGGYIIMGAEDDGTPIGINRNMVKDMKKKLCESTQ